MDDSEALVLLALAGLLGWELYYIVHNFGWMAYLYVTLFELGQGILFRVLK
jgi:hypothetical protein